MVANDVSKENASFGTDTKEVFLVDPKRNIIHIALSDKTEVAKWLIDRILEALKA